MVDLIHLAEACLKNPSRDIALHRKSGEAHPLSKTMRAALLLRERVTFGSKKEQELLDYLLDEADSFAVFPHYEPSYWKRFRASYLSCEKNLGAEEIETLIKSHSSFLKYLESKGMLEHCADSLLYANAKDIGEWAFINEIVEKEAGKEQYKELRKALEVYAEQHFEKRYSSRTLFGIDSTDIGQCGTVFTVMGKDNPEIVGISFYIGYGANQYYSIFENGEKDAYPMMLMGSLVSFYVEQHPDSHMFPFKNPLGKDNRFSCLSIRHGVKAHCRLGRVL
ncbi:MAG: hypothetical protein J6038_03435, partial [Bacilli bacterium]|nr:hypothetical protein [Bacilli bacterium]